MVKTPSPKKTSASSFKNMVTPDKKSSSPRGTQRTQPSHAPISSGLCVRKYFHTFGWFNGEVVQQNIDKTWTVRYEDDDEEDVDETVIHELMRNYNNNVNGNENAPSKNKSSSKSTVPQNNSASSTSTLSKESSTHSSRKVSVRNSSNEGKNNLKSSNKKSSWVSKLLKSPSAKHRIGRRQKLNMDYDLGTFEELGQVKEYSEQTMKGDAKNIAQYHEFVSNQEKIKPFRQAHYGEGELYSRVKVASFLRYLIVDSVKCYEKYGVHRYTTESLRWGQLAACKRHARVDDSKNERVYNTAAWENLAKEFKSTAALNGMPEKGDDIFFATQTWLAYVLALAPQGANYYIPLAAYLALLRCGFRRHMVDRAKLKNIVSVTEVVPARTDSSKRKRNFINSLSQIEVCLKLKYGKRWPKRRFKTAYALGRMEFDYMTSPDVVTTLGDHIWDLYGISLLKLDSERNKQSAWWREHCNDLLFQGCDTVFFADKLKFLSDLAGMPIELRIAMHSSMRAGALVDAINNVEQKKVGTSAVNATFGWDGDQIARVATTNYGGREALEGSVYANKVTARTPDFVYRSDLEPVGELRDEDDGPLTSLVRILQRDPKLKRVKWIHDPRDLTNGQKPDYDLVKRVVYPPNSLIGSARKALNRAVAVIGVVKLGVDLKFQNESSLVKEGKRALLNKIRGMPRKEMQLWIKNNVVKYYNENMKWKTYVDTFFPSINATTVTFEATKVRKAFVSVAAMTLKQLVLIVNKIPGDTVVSLTDIVAQVLKIKDISNLHRYAKKRNLLKIKPIYSLSPSELKSYQSACEAHNSLDSRREWSNEAETDLISFLENYDGVLRLHGYTNIIIKYCPSIRADGRSPKSIINKIANLMKKAKIAERKDGRKLNSNDSSSESDGYGKNKKKESGKLSSFSSSDEDSDDNNYSSDDGYILKKNQYFPDGVDYNYLSSQDNSSCNSSDDTASESSDTSDNYNYGLDELPSVYAPWPNKASRISDKRFVKDPVSRTFNRLSRSSSKLSKKHKHDNSSSQSNQSRNYKRQGDANLNSDNDSDGDDLPEFTGGWTYDPQLPFTHRVIQGQPAAFHGLQQPAALGAGIPIDNANVAYNCGGNYNPLWVVPNSNLNNIGVRTATRDAGWCCICGWKLLNRQKYYLLSPASGKDNQINYCHYPCFSSRVLQYDYARMQAVSCCQTPPLQNWALSANFGHQKPANAPLGWVKWVYIEVIDLFVALKLSGCLPPQVHGENVIVNNPINWERVLSFSPVLRSNSKTVQQIKKKWENERRHMFRYMTVAFFQAQVADGLINQMP